MNLSKKDPLASAIDKVFGLKTPTATAIIELILLLAFIVGCGFAYQYGPPVLKIPMGLLIGLGTYMAILLLFRVLAVALNSSK